MGCPCALGGGQARPINRGLPGGLRASCLPLCLRCLFSSGRMAALNMLWTGLALLGILGVLQIPTQAQAALQPNFQEDKVRGSSPGPQGGTGLCREQGAPWGPIFSLGRGC